MILMAVEGYALARAAAVGAIGELGGDAVRQSCRHLARRLEDPDLVRGSESTPFRAFGWLSYQISTVW